MNSSTSLQQKQENLPFDPYRQKLVPKDYIKWTNSLRMYFFFKVEREINLKKKSSAVLTFIY